MEFDTTSPLPDPELRRLWKTYLQAEADRAAACVAAADAKIAYDANPPSNLLDAARARLEVADLSEDAATAARRSTELYQQFLNRFLAVR